MQAVSVKIFSLMPTSMVDERAMSVATWINSPKRNRQDVATVSNHLAIRSNFMDFQNAVRTPFIYDSLKLTEYSIPPQRLLTVNWRDMKKTIFGKDDSDKSLVSTSSSTSGTESNTIYLRVRYQTRTDPLIQARRARLASSGRGWAPKPWMRRSAHLARPLPPSPQTYLYGLPGWAPNPEKNRSRYLYIMIIVYMFCFSSFTCFG